MANLVRYPLDEAFDDLLRGFFVRPLGFECSTSQAQAAQFRVDVSEAEQAYTIRAEIPGVKKDDINISIDGNQVAISAEIKNEKEAKDGERVLPPEREVRRRHPRADAAEESRGPGEAHHHSVTGFKPGKNGRLCGRFFRPKP